ncbi:hypothetical protein [Streptomyces sp. NPDC056255]
MKTPRNRAKLPYDASSTDAVVIHPCPQDRVRHVARRAAHGMG